VFQMPPRPKMDLLGAGWNDDFRLWERLLRVLSIFSLVTTNLKGLT
jgi:hypothetical protein